MNLFRLPSRLPAFRRTAAVLLAAAAMLISLQGVASAHVVKGQYGDQYLTTVTSVTPATPGLTVTATTDGQEITFAYTGSKTVIIYGYFHEQYLRITSSGVDENTNSPSVDLNASQNISNLGDGSGINKAPVWKHISDQKVATYHDHRIHWMGAEAPPIAQKDPGHTHLIDTWKLDVAVGSTPVVVTGTLTWLPFTPGSKLPLVIAIVATVIVLALIVFFIRRRRKTISAQPLAEPAPVV